MSQPVNQWIGEGKIGTDLKLRHTRDSARPVLNMLLFMESNYRSKKNVDSDFVIKKRYAKIPVVAWHNKASEIAENFQRNDKVRIQGSIRTRLVEKDGFKYSTFEIVLDDIILLARKEQFLFAL